MSTNNHAEQKNPTSGTRVRKAERMIAAARGVVLWERVWPALWPGLGLIGLYAILALTGILEMLPAWLRVSLLFAFSGLVFACFWRSFGPLRRVRWEDGARRVERDSELANRPLTEGADEIATGRDDPMTAALWRAHVLRLLASAGRLRLKLPSPGMKRRDRYGVRFAVLAGLVAAFFIAGPMSVERLRTALMPPLSDPLGAAMFNAWVSPPPYTGQPPRTLAQGSELVTGLVMAPAGSTLVLRVADTNGHPRLSILPAQETVIFERSESGYEARIALDHNIQVTARLGARPLGAWQFLVQDDAPPSIAFAEPPRVEENRSVTFSYTASDDYGVVSVLAEIVPLNDDTQIASDPEPFLVALAPAANAREIEQTIARNLTAHIYAGTKVSITLVANDAAGQMTRSEAEIMDLPQRIFTHPLARALIEQRKDVAIGGHPGRGRAEEAMDALTIGPEIFYENDFTNYLALRTLKYRLANIRSEEESFGAMGFMWDMAVALEEGDLADAAEALRAAQEALMAAIERGASEEEIQELMNRLRQAMARYMQQMAQNAQSMQGQMQQMPPNAQMISPQDLEDLLAMIEELLRTGATEQAMELLAGLMQMLENMRMAGVMQGQPGQQGQGQQQGQPGDGAAQDAIRGLSDLMGNQRQLLDETFRAQRGQGQPGQPGQGQPGQGQPGEDGQPVPGQSDQMGPGAMAQEQGDLRSQLGQIIQGLNGNGLEVPDGLNGAGEYMGQSQGDLENSQYGSAVQAQENVLEQMRQGARVLARELMGENAGDQAGGDQNLDPLGRPLGANGSLLGGMLQMPNQSDVQRAREILDELRRRAAELGRSQQELEYIERLLQLF